MKKGHKVLLLSILLLVLTMISAYPVLAEGKTTDTTVSASGTGSTSSPSSYVILGANDLGMHCMQDDYSAFMVLPPANTVRVQVLKDKVPITTGITVTYSYSTHTNNPATNNNFWTYAPQFGFSGLSEGQGIAGNYLTGTMKPNADGLSFSAEYLPITPYDDSGKFDPYPSITVTAKDLSGNVLATSEIVTPTSSEMSCFGCHGTTNTYQNILQSHDNLSATTLYTDYTNGKVHACSECHQDNALSRSGKTGVKPLSQAMHGFHAVPVANLPASQQLTPSCYNCHPGPNTQCLRGVMASSGDTCTNCHGDMDNVATTQANGRQAWLEEPKCASCHGSTYSENPNTLYRNSILQNSINRGMNGLFYCESCHNSTHAEWPSMNAADNKLPLTLQGMNGPMTCVACHPSRTTGTMHRKL
jgi:hypothetical protein